MKKTAKKKVIPKKKVVSAKKETPPPFYILWNPKSVKPPRVRYATREDGDRVGKWMRDRHNEPFYLMAPVALFSPQAISMLPHSYEEWKARGYHVKPGERHSYRRVSDGQPVFTESQVSRIIGYNAPYGSLRDDPGYD